MKSVSILLLTLALSHAVFAQSSLELLPTVELRAWSTEGPHAVLDASFRSYELIEIDAQALLLALEGGGADLRIGSHAAEQMRVHPASLRADNYRSLSDSGEAKQISARRAQNLRHFRSSAADDNHDKSANHTALSVADDFVLGQVVLSGERYMIEPLRYFEPSASSKAYVLYPIAAVLDNKPRTCGLDEVQQRSKMLEPQVAEVVASPLAGECVKIRLVLASDYAMYVAHGPTAGDVINYLESVINLIAANYDDEFDYAVEFTIVEQYVSTSNSTSLETALTSTANAGTLLANFSTWGRSAQGFTQLFDLASLWVTRDIFSVSGMSNNYATVGVAYTGGVCTETAKFSLIEDQSIAEARRLVVAHEFGHNFNVGHVVSSTSIMNASFNPSTAHLQTLWLASSVAELESRTNSGDCGLGSGALVGTPHAEPMIQSALCLNKATPISDLGYRAPTSWLWSAPGGTLGASNAQNTTVSYATTGMKTITLTSSNSACGASTSDVEAVPVEVLASTAPANTCNPPTVNTGSSAPAGSTYGIGIRNVSFLSVNHSSGDSSEDDIAYEDMTCSEFGTTSSLSVPISVTVSSSPANYAQRVRIFVDDENDGFTGLEDMLVDATSVAPGSTGNYVLNLPPGTPTNQLLRIRVSVDHEATTNAGCGGTSYGQVEDYSLLLSAPLPAELTDLRLEQLGSKATLYWTVAQEVAVSHYRVEHQEASGDWTTAGTVAVKGRSLRAQAYAFALGELSAGTHYFRLTTVDVDATLSNSEVLSMQVYEPFGMVALYPNPTQSGMSALHLPPSLEAIEVTLVDVAGRALERWRVSTEAARTLALDLGGLPRGVYHVRVQVGGTPTVLRLVH